MVQQQLLNELNSLASKKTKTQEYINRANTIGFIGQFKRNYIGIKDNHNDRYTTDELRKLVGEEYFDEALEVFKLSMTSKLIEIDALISEEMNNYNISKDL